MNKKYGTNEVSKITGISSDLIRKYCTFFEIEVERKKLDTGKPGHRQFSDENIKELKDIKKNIADGISWENILAAKKGDKVIVPKKPNNSLESKVEDLEKIVKSLVEKDEKREKAFIDLMNNFEQFSNRANLEREQIEALKKENTELKNQQLQIEHQPEEVQKEDSKKKSFWQRLFS